jgi:hypothetical protein
MGRGRRPFTQSDVAKAIKAITAAGHPVTSVCFSREGFTVMIGKPNDNGNGDAETNPWDEVLNVKEAALCAAVGSPPARWDQSEALLPQARFQACAVARDASPAIAA